MLIMAKANACSYLAFFALSARFVAVYAPPVRLWLSGLPVCRLPPLACLPLSSRSRLVLQYLPYHSKRT